MFKKYIKYLESFTALENVNVRLKNNNDTIHKLLLACKFSLLKNGAYKYHRTTPVTKLIEY